VKAMVGTVMFVGWCDVYGAKWVVHDSGLLGRVVGVMLYYVNIIVISYRYRWVVNWHRNIH